VAAEVSLRFSLPPPFPAIKHAPPQGTMWHLFSVL